jgi:hypothetical protein
MLLFIACSEPDPVVAPEPEPEYRYIYLRDFMFEQGRVYDLTYDIDTRPHDEYVPIGRYDKIIRLSVFVERAIPDIATHRARVLVDPTVSSELPFQSEVELWVKEVPQQDLVIYDDHRSNQHYFIFQRRPRNIGLVMGAAMVIERYGWFGGPLERLDTVGNVEGDVYELMMLQSSEPTDSEHPAWPLMWRNVYRIPMNAELHDMSFRILKGLPHTEGTDEAVDFQTGPVGNTPFLEILGLDQYGTRNRQIPDGLIDDRSEIYRSDLGLLIFPHRFPFASDTTFQHEDGSRSPPLELLLPLLYRYDSRQEQVQATTYFLEIGIPRAVPQK